MIELISLFRSFGHAISGFFSAVVTERNLRIHLTALVLVVLFGNYAQLSSVHWCLVVLCCMAVISLELINTSLEYLCDCVTTEFNPKIRLAKDISAGAVLISALGSVVIALLLLIGDNRYLDNISAALLQNPSRLAILSVTILAGILFVFLPSWFQKHNRKRRV